MIDSILTKLGDVSSRYEEIETLLSQPDITSNQEEYIKLSKEYSDLSPLVTAFISFKRAEEDIEEAKAHLDKYGMALIANVLNEDEVDEMDKRLNEQFLGEEKHKVGSKVRGDEGLGVQSTDEEKVSRLGGYESLAMGHSTPVRRWIGIGRYIAG